MIIKLFLAFLSLSLSVEYCHYNCEECEEYSESDSDMKCTSCRDNYYFKLNTNNCLDKKEFPDYYISNGALYPCSDYDENHCYECDPSLNTIGKCLSCAGGYMLDKETNECIKCDGLFFLITSPNGCKDAYFQKCKLAFTCCYSTNNCASILPLGCQKDGIKPETCIISNKHNINVFIHWLYDKLELLKYPTYNFDSSGYLLIELSLNDYYIWNLRKSIKRKIYFYNEEGRGLFDEINDEYQKLIDYPKFNKRYNSYSIALKTNTSEEYKYFLNFENYNNNLELIDIKTGEIIMDNLFDLFWEFDFDYVQSSPILMTELYDKNQYLIATYAIDIYYKELYILYWIFSLEDSTNKNVNFNSIYQIDSNSLYFNDWDTFNKETRFCFVQTKKGDLFVSFVSKGSDLFIYDIENQFYYYFFYFGNPLNFHKFLLIKDEIKFLIYYTNNKNFDFIIFDHMNNGEEIHVLLESNIEIDDYIEYFNSDIIFLSEAKAAFVLEEFNITYIYLIYFFNDYHNYMVSKIILNTKIYLECI